MSIIPLEKLLKKGSGDALGDIVQSAREMGEWQARVARFLDPELAENLVAANLRENRELVLIASTSQWAARLRFEVPEIMSKLEANGSAVASCKVRVSQQD